jgi:hypothetical protein
MKTHQRGAELSSKSATDVFAVTVLAEQLDCSALFRNNAVSRILRATSLRIVVKLEYVRDVRVSACEYNILLVTTFTLGVYFGETRRARSNSYILQILGNIQYPYSDVGVAIPNVVDLNLITMKQFC